MRWVIAGVHVWVWLSAYRLLRVWGWLSFWHNWTFHLHVDLHLFDFYGKSSKRSNTIRYTAATENKRESMHFAEHNPMWRAGRARDVDPINIWKAQARESCLPYWIPTICPETLTPLLECHLEYEISMLLIMRPWQRLWQFSYRSIQNCQWREWALSNEFRTASFGFLKGYHLVPRGDDGSHAHPTAIASSEGIRFCVTISYS